MLVRLIKTNDLGDTIWTKTIGGNDLDEGHSIQKTIDGGFIIVGYTRSYGVGERDALLIKTNSLGDVLWIKTFGGIHYDYGNSVYQTADWGFIITGGKDFITPFNGDLWLIKTTPDVSSVKQIDVILPSNYSLSQNYPNPFNSTTIIKYGIPEKSDVTLKICNSLGQQVLTLINEKKEAGNYEVTFDASSLPSGVYSYQLQAGDFIQTKKMILMK